MSVVWLTGARSPVHLVYSSLYMKASLGMTSAKPTYKMQNIFPIPPATCTWRITVFTENKSGFDNRLKFIPQM